jgi:hypothetical protein
MGLSGLVVKAVDSTAVLLPLTDVRSNPTSIFETSYQASYMNVDGSTQVTTRIHVRAPEMFLNIRHMM